MIQIMKDSQHWQQNSYTVRQTFMVYSAADHESLNDDRCDSQEKWRTVHKSLTWTQWTAAWWKRLHIAWQQLWTWELVGWSSELAQLLLLLVPGGRGLVVWLMYRPCPGSYLGSWRGGPLGGQLLLLLLVPGGCGEVVWLLNRPCPGSEGSTPPARGATHTRPAPQWIP